LTGKGDRAVCAVDEEIIKNSVARYLLISQLSLTASPSGEAFFTFFLCFLKKWLIYGNKYDKL
ncbi:MAG: hypothetical protein J5832_01710, partial [Clostridia bacterium]|nr:hypothetical protein [Clostridia bacterium]